MPTEATAAPSRRKKAPEPTTRDRFFLDQAGIGSPVNHNAQRHPDAVAHWCGTFHDCPRQNITLAGVSFPRNTERLSHPKGAYKTRRVPMRGAIAWLTPKESEAVKKAASLRVVRWLAVQPENDDETRRGRVLVKRSRYQEMIGDEPLGHYIYFLTVEDAATKMGATWMQEAPPPLEAA